MWLCHPRAPPEKAHRIRKCVLDIPQTTFSALVPAIPAQAGDAIPAHLSRKVFETDGLALATPIARTFLEDPSAGFATAAAETALREAPVIKQMPITPN